MQVAHITLVEISCRGSFYINMILVHMIIRYCRAHRGSEFDVANTLAKWKKLKPNEINFSQGFVLYLNLCPLGATFVGCR